MSTTPFVTGHCPVEIRDTGNVEDIRSLVLDVNDFGVEYNGVIIEDLDFEDRDGVGWYVGNAKGWMLPTQQAMIDAHNRKAMANSKPIVIEPEANVPG